MRTELGVFDFFADGKKHRFGWLNKAIEQNGDGWLTFDHNVTGILNIRPYYVFQYGIPEHIFIGGVAMDGIY